MCSDYQRCSFSENKNVNFNFDSCLAFESTLVAFVDDGMQLGHVLSKLIVRVTNCIAQLTFVGIFWKKRSSFNYLTICKIKYKVIWKIQCSIALLLRYFVFPNENWSFKPFIWKKYLWFSEQPWSFWISRPTRSSFPPFQEIWQQLRRCAASFWKSVNFVDNFIAFRGILLSAPNRNTSDKNSLKHIFIKSKNQFQIWTDWKVTKCCKAKAWFNIITRKKG